MFDPGWHHFVVFFGNLDIILEQYARKNKQSTVNRFRCVEVISFALRATKPRFDPRRKHFSVPVITFDQQAKL